MTLSLIVVKSINHVIGNNNQLPWHLPADLAHFKKITLGKPIIMGRKTADSIGKPLPGRRNIVISRDKKLQMAGYDIFCTIDDALHAVKNEPEIIIIGGANVFLQTLSIAHTVYLTIIDAKFEGDTFFPDLNPAEWKLILEEKYMPDEKNVYPYRFLKYVRRIFATIHGTNPL